MLVGLIILITDGDKYVKSVSITYECVGIATLLQVQDKST